MAVSPRGKTADRGEVMGYKLDTKGKFLFLFLSSVSLILTMVITTLLWWFISPRLHEINSYLALVVLSALRVFYLIVIYGIIILYLACYNQYSYKFIFKLIRFVIIFLFPVNVFVGRCIGISRDRIRESFVKVNNSFLDLSTISLLPDKILILLPHCLQNYNCTYRITNDIRHCNECKQCIIYVFKELIEKYRIQVVIATGGTLARKVIIDLRPYLIIAVACQRDLVDGILDAYPIPVFGILNERPNGPCVNTTVDINQIDNFLENICVREI